MRFGLAVWLALFAVQNADVLALVVPDGCIELTTDGHRGDQCPENCTRCVCCAPIFLAPLPASALTGWTVTVAAPPDYARPLSPSPRGVLHVPKTR